MLALLVFGVYVLCLWVGNALILRYGELPDPLRFKIVGGFVVLSVICFGLALPFDASWPIVIWYWVAGLLTGVPIGEFRLKRNRDAVSTAC